VVGQTDPIACSVQTLLLILKYSKEHIPYFCDYQVIQLMVKETKVTKDSVVLRIQVTLKKHIELLHYRTGELQGLSVPTIFFWKVKNFEMWMLWFMPQLTGNS
jgi:hypothetical protein